MANYGLLGAMRGYVQGNNILRAQGIQDAQLRAEAQTRGLQDQLMQDKINSDSTLLPLQQQDLQNRVQLGATQAQTAQQTQGADVTAAKAKAQDETNAAGLSAAQLKLATQTMPDLIRERQAQASTAELDADRAQKNNIIAGMNLTTQQANMLWLGIARSAGVIGTALSQPNPNLGQAQEVYNETVAPGQKIKNLTAGPETQDPMQRQLSWDGPKGHVVTTYGNYLHHAAVLAPADPVGVMRDNDQTYDKRTGQVIAGAGGNIPKMTTLTPFETKTAFGGPDPSAIPVPGSPAPTIVNLQKLQAFQNWRVAQFRETGDKSYLTDPTISLIRYNSAQAQQLQQNGAPIVSRAAQPNFGVGNGSSSLIPAQYAKIMAQAQDAIHAGKDPAAVNAMLRKLVPQQYLNAAGS